MRALRLAHHVREQPPHEHLSVYVATLNDVQDAMRQMAIAQLHTATTSYTVSCYMAQHTSR